ncbi:MAG: methyltransferase domain-containing protein [Pirellulaceae bacterium]
MMAKQVAPEGKVLAVDIQQEMLHLLQLRGKEQGVDNIEPILSSVVDPKLPKIPSTCYSWWTCIMSFSHPEQMLQGIRESLKPKGVVALLEYREEDRTVPIKPLHKMNKKQILREYRANGFRLVKQYDGLPWQHLMFFERDPDWKPRQSSGPNDQ